MMKPVKFIFSIILLGTSMITPLLAGEPEVPSWALGAVLLAGMSGTLLSEAFPSYKEDK